MTPEKPEGIDPKHLKLSYRADGPVSRRALFFGRLTPHFLVVPAVEPEVCAAWKGCAQCVAACPQQAIAIEASAATVNKTKCIGCGACLPVCPVGAIRQPILSPERLEAELRTLLQNRAAGAEPRILFLLADGGPPPDQFNGLPSLSLPSVGAISPWLLLRAFTLGAAGIAVLPCQPGCRHGCDQARWERTLSLTRELLDRLGIETERILAVDRGPARLRLKTFAEVLASLRPHHLKPGSLNTRNVLTLANLLKGLVALTPDTPAPVTGADVPFGVVRVQASRCTLCGACPERCPTGALKFQEDKDGSHLLFEHAGCVACEACMKVCPEDAVGVERRLEFSRLGTITLLAEDRMARCQRCGAAIAPLSMLRKVQTALGRGTPSSPNCPSCQMLKGLAAVEDCTRAS